jgi:hypothetical protein
MSVLSSCLYLGPYDVAWRNRASQTLRSIEAQSRRSKVRASNQLCCQGFQFAVRPTQGSILDGPRQGVQTAHDETKRPIEGVLKKVEGKRKDLGGITSKRIELGVGCHKPSDSLTCSD